MKQKKQDYLIGGCTKLKEKLVIEDISKTYGDVTVLEKLCCKIYDGEFLSILGPSGCGKTTLLRILIGILEPCTGSIKKEGIDITHAHPSARGMGIVFQNYALFQNMTVLGNVSYALRVNKINKRSRSEAKDIAVNIIERVGLAKHMQKKPALLSGGEQQRVALARTLAMSPEMILLDEPMSALDVATRLQLRSELKDIQKEFRTTMIYVTHDQEEAFAMSDRIMVMDSGKMVQIDTPETIINAPANDYISEFVVKNLKLKLESLRKYL
jgi:ABC-type Fe3+/spermidine/putrescine transport system ATPase subunit